MRRGAWQPAEGERKRDAAPPAAKEEEEEEEEEEVVAPLARALGVTRGCWSLKRFRGRIGSVGCEVLCPGSWRRGDGSGERGG